MREIAPELWYYSIIGCGAVRAVIASYDDARRRVRAANGLRARAGEVAQFTGISDPYEPPADAEIVLDTTHTPVTASARESIDDLSSSGYLLAPLTRKIAALHGHADHRASRHGPCPVRKARRRP
jgi:hypothetical protein